MGIFIWPIDTYNHSPVLIQTLQPTTWLSDRRNKHVCDWKMLRWPLLQLLTRNSLLSFPIWNSSSIKIQAKPVNLRPWSVNIHCQTRTVPLSNSTFGDTATIIHVHESCERSIAVVNPGINQAKTELKLINGPSIIARSPMSYNIDPTDAWTSVLISGWRAFCDPPMLPIRLACVVTRVSRTCYPRMIYARGWSELACHRLSSENFAKRSVAVSFKIE